MGAPVEVWSYVASLLLLGGVGQLGAFHVVDVLAGTGVVSSSVTQRDSFSGTGAIKAETANRVSMRETIVLGLRYSNYSPVSFAHFVIGAELNGMFGRPLFRVTGSLRNLIRKTNSLAKLCSQ